MERQVEQRNYKETVEVREGPNGPMICGYMAVFNRPSSDMGFVETIDPAAFNKTLQEADVRGIGNHNTDWLLGRTKSDTMRLRNDGTGVWYEIDVNMQDPDGQRGYQKVQRRDWDGSSFSFTTVRDEWNWNTQPPERRLLEVSLVEGGPCTFPAYPDATAAARALSPVADKLGKPVASLVAALRDPVELRSLIGGDMSTTETEPVVETPTEEPAEDSAEPAAESRAGKVISSKNMEALQSLHDTLTSSASAVRDLMDTALSLAPADSHVADAATLNEDGAGDGDERGLSILSAQVELRQRLVAAEAA